MVSLQGLKSFNGQLCQKCKRNIPHIPQIQFQKISNPFATDILQDKALGDLSADQGLLLEYCIRTEVKNVVEKCGVRKMGPPIIEDGSL